MALILAVILSVYGQVSYSAMGNDWKGLCQSGKSQSPIDINELEVIEVISSTSMYVSLNLTQIIEGHFGADSSFNVKMITEFGQVTINKENFDVTNVHFHAPSEHHINGLQFDLELHLFGTSSTNNSNYEVIALMFNAGKNSNQFIQNAIDSYKTANYSHFNISWILPLGSLKSYYTYSGSATAPILKNDCGEGVTWNIIDTPLEISKDQLKFFTDKWAGNSSFAGGNGNNRAIQKLNNRKVFHILNTQSYSLYIAVNFIAFILNF